MARGPTDGLEGRTLRLGRLGTERCAHMIKSYGGGGGRPGTGYVHFYGKYIEGKYPICQMYGLIYAICIFNFILRPRTLSTQAILDYIDILLCFSVVLNLKAIFKHEENRPLFVCFYYKIIHNKKLYIQLSPGIVFCFYTKGDTNPLSILALSILM